MSVRPSLCVYPQGFPGALSNSSSVDNLPLEGGGGGVKVVGWSEQSV